MSELGKYIELGLYQGQDMMLGLDGSRRTYTIKEVSDSTSEDGLTTVELTLAVTAVLAGNEVNVKNILGELRGNTIYHNDWDITAQPVAENEGLIRVTLSEKPKKKREINIEPVDEAAVVGKEEKAYV